MENRLESDSDIICNWINNSSSNKEAFMSMLRKGPPANKGFMWCSKEGGPGKYWSKEEAEALNSLSDYILDMGWESSGYSIMIRNIQNKMC